MFWLLNYWSNRYVCCNRCRHVPHTKEGRNIDDFKSTYVTHVFWYIVEFLKERDIEIFFRIITNFGIWPLSQFQSTKIKLIPWEAVGCHFPPLSHAQILDMPISRNIHFLDFNYIDVTIIDKYAWVLGESPLDGLTINT